MQLINTWANTAFVAFAVNHTDGGVGFYIQADGTTKREECVPAGDNIPNPLPWGTSVCL